MCTAHLLTIYVLVATTRCQYWGLGSQVNKFEHASSDDHQMSVVGGRGEGVGTQVLCLGQEGGRYPGSIFREGER